MSRIAGPTEVVRGLMSASCHAPRDDVATTTTMREFIRDSSRIKKAVANGDEIIVRDRQGQPERLTPEFL
jgi:hypothetical protein